MSQLVPSPAAEQQIPTHLFFANEEQMLQAQQHLVQLFSQRMESAQRELADAEANLAAAHNAVTHLNIAPFSRQVSRARKRVEFFEKAVAVTKHGYAVVPNFPHADTFMIRTTRSVPNRAESSYRWESFEQTSSSPAIGDGRYVDSLPEVVQWTETDKDGKEIKKYGPAAFNAVVDFPMAVAHPKVMAALDRAVELEAFDEIAIAPGRRSQGDPIVIGKIQYPNNKTRHLSFLICWYVDVRTI